MTTKTTTPTLLHRFRSRRGWLIASSPVWYAYCVNEDAKRVIRVFPNPKDVDSEDDWRLQVTDDDRTFVETAGPRAVILRMVDRWEHVVGLIPQLRYAAGGPEATAQAVMMICRDDLHPLCRVLGLPTRGSEARLRAAITAKMTGLPTAEGVRPE